MNQRPGVWTDDSSGLHGRGSSSPRPDLTPVPPPQPDAAAPDPSYGAYGSGGGHYDSGYGQGYAYAAAPPVPETGYHQGYRHGHGYAAAPPVSADPGYGQGYTYGPTPPAPENPGYDQGYRHGHTYGPTPPAPENPGYDTGHDEGRPFTSAPHAPGRMGYDADDDDYDDYDDRPRTSRGRRIVVGFVTLVSVGLATTVGTYLWATFSLNHEVDFGEVGERPEAGQGTNYLIVGSDSREGLSGAQQKQMHTGAVDGQRTDSIMILHVGRNGNTMVSLPRDSWVTIPEWIDPMTGKRHPPTKNKLNAAFSQDGAELLIRTVEHNTGLRIDHYTEIGFAGFAHVVDALGGVEMCLDRAIKDEKSGADLQKGCQKLDGTQSLAFVRQRHQEAEGDLGRTKNQQKFLSALASQATSTNTLANPLKLYPTAGAGLDSLILDKDMTLQDLASLFLAMKEVSGGKGRQMNMPVATIGLATSKGSAIKWDMAKARQLMSELKNDGKVTVSSK